MSERKACPQCLRLIGDKTRVKIIQQLRKKPNNASGIGASFPLSQPTVSHHLKILEKIGIVFSKKQGREIFYFLNTKYPCKKCNIFKLPLKV